MSSRQARSEVEIPDDLKQSAEDEAFVDAFVERNRPALEKMIEEARASIARGEGKTYTSADDLFADIVRKSFPPSKVE
jgi:hypothetical protein